MAFFDCPRGHRVPRRLACFQARALPYRLLLPPEIERLKEPDGHRWEMVPKDGQTLSQRRSSCLLFQIVGVETYLLLPHDQGDRGNLPGQGQAGHRGLPPLGQ